MRGRFCLLTAVAASGAVHSLSVLPGRVSLVWTGIALVIVSCVAMAARCLCRHGWSVPIRLSGGAASRCRVATTIMLVLWVAYIAFASTVWRAQALLDDRLAPDNENKVSRVVLRIATLPRLSPDRRQFEAEVLSSRPMGVPSRILVSWSLGKWGGPYGSGDSRPADFPDLIPGQIWRMALTLKVPHGERNPHGFDYEGHLFARGIRATGSVRGTPRYLRDEPWASLPVVAERARHVVRKAMRPYLEGRRYGAVQLALAIGDQDSVPSGDWTIFNVTGITHLVSISGSHITMIAALGGVLALRLWPLTRLGGRALAERVPAQVAGAMAALLVAWVYCLLAGWGVPARRTFVMLAVLACARAARIPLGVSRALCLVLFVVVALDPWAVLASGFWLSFGAVGILLASGGWSGHPMTRSTPSRWDRFRQSVGLATRLQLAITAGLTPILAGVFHQVSVISPLVNAYAIPAVELLVTPLSLLTAAAALVPGLDWLAGAFAWLGHGVLASVMAPTVWLAGSPVATFDAAAPPLWVLVSASAGLVIAILSWGFRDGRIAWLLLIPAVWWRADRPGQGEWRLAALDVGQAGAVVVQTARHALVFDTGLRTGPDSDSGARTILPYLRATGVRRIDALVVSHADIDHAGGARSLLSALPVMQSYSSFDLAAYLRREARLLGRPDDLPPLPGAMSACVAGGAWEIDGVHFQFVWPPKGGHAAHDRKRVKRNDRACVLMVRGAHHSMLLTSDVGLAQESALLHAGVQGVDVVMAAHHGSRHSSGEPFVRAMRARHVIAQAGKWNRYGHPDQGVEARWKSSGATFWRTDRQGAVLVRSESTGLRVETTRSTQARYWQDKW
ncbi:MAG TPA: DNA internalization-related competence protein ComEC/Rec2 [Burkholderiaceae bacterium]|nr:DNA internalization-related competence protein ComEC/Rec2 [Burkholderiaceae bacterium]